jgi:DNA-binding NarL/FixJ family response regulator
MPTASKIRLLIADDQEVVRLGLKALLADTEVKIVAAVAGGQAAVEYALEHELDLALLEARMAAGDGLTALGRIKLKKPDLPILMFSAFDNPTYEARAAAFGANGYLLKSCSRDELLSAIRMAADGQRVWTRDGFRRVTGAMSTPRLSAECEVPLTAREGEVLRQMALGSTNKQIAEALPIGIETVKEHIQHILRKIGVTDRTQAAVWAVRNGLA